MLYEDRLDGCITYDKYDGLSNKFKEEQSQIQDKLSKLKLYNHNEQITVEFLLKLAKKGIEVFNCLEPDEKREILSLILPNIKLEGKKLVYSIRKPFGHS